LLYGGLLTFGVYAFILWWFVYRKLPLVIDDEGITLRDQRRFLWRDMSTFVHGEDLALRFGETMVSILPSDLENGSEALKFALARAEEARGGKKASPRSRQSSGKKETARKGSSFGGKMGSNFHFLTTFERGLTRAQLGKRLRSDKGLEYNAKQNTLDQDTALVPPFEHVKYAFDGDALREIRMELTFRGDWVDFETHLRDALFSLEGIGTLVERDDKPFTPERARTRLEEGASGRVAGVMFTGEHPKGKLTGVIRARSQGLNQIYMFTASWEPAGGEPSAETSPQASPDA
jgi:hypothetical protein